MRLENVAVTGNDFVGGLLGHNLGLITGSYAIGGTVKGGNNVGGLVGQNFYNGRIEGCFVVATVNGAGDNIGCLLGSNYNGEVNESYAAGGVTGNSKVGGLAGYSDGDITDCYAIGAVTAGAGSAGGLVGHKPAGTVTASYYDSTTTGQADVGKGESKNTEEMKQEATFDGWDFAEPGVWRNVEGYTYPVLQWQPFSTLEIDAMIGKDKEDLAIVFAEGDSAGGVTRNLTLPETGAYGTTIVWSSDDPLVIADDGTVEAPSDGSKTVTLTATVSKAGGIAQTKEFTLTVVPNVPSDNADLSGLVLSQGTLTPVFNQTVTGYSASVDSSVASVDVIPTTADSNAKVTVNGNHVASGRAEFVSLNVGTNAITIVVTAENGTTSKTYTITVNRASSGSGGGGGGRTHNPAPVNHLTVDSSGNISTVPKLDKNTDVAAVVIDTVTMAKAFDNSAENIYGNNNTVIAVPEVEGAKAYECTLPASIFSSSDVNHQLEIKTGIAAVTLPTNMLTQETAAGAENISLTIAQADISAVDEETRNRISDRPVIQLSLELDGELYAWSNESAPVTVSIPYTPTEEELADPEHITVWYIDGAGNVVEVPSGRYDHATGTVTFSTTHFSSFAVVYVTKTFDDLGSALWAKKPIEVLASKGILKGISEKEYAPQTNITRADFLYYLVRTMGVDAKVEGNFDDISRDAYYYKEIGIAKKLGITNGRGNNKFSPDASITRQDMMVLTERALRMLKKLEGQGTTADLDKFADKSLIAAYAVNGVASVVKEGLIVGSGDRINPLGNTTRAEAAVFLHRIYQR